MVKERGKVCDFKYFFLDNKTSKRTLQSGSWFLLPALPVQQGSRKGAVYSALIIYQGGRDCMSSFSFSNSNTLLSLWDRRVLEFEMLQSLKLSNITARDFLDG